MSARRREARIGMSESDSRQHDVRVAGGDRVGRVRDGLAAGGAGAVQRIGGDLFGELGQETHLARDIRNER